MATLALVGCGHIHTPGFIGVINKRDDITVKWVWDHDPARAALRAGDLKSQTTDDLNVIWSDPEVDAIVVCSETDRHLDLVLPAANAKKHLFVEKPLGFGKEDAEKMAAAISAAGVIFSTGYFSRGNQAIQALKAQLEAGSLGTITRVRGSNCHNGALGGWFDGEWRWMADVKQAGVGAYGDLGTHSLDILLWLFGDVDAVAGVLSMGTARYEGCDETGEAILKFKSGVIGTLAAAWDDVANPVGYLVSGTKGHAVIIDGQLFLNIPGTEHDGKTPVAGTGVPAGFDAWLNAVNGDTSGAIVPVNEAAYRSTVMEAIYKAAQTETWVKIS